MKVFQLVLFLFLIVCAISVSFSKNLLNSIIIFMSYSLIMSIIWILLERVGYLYRVEPEEDFPVCEFESV